MATKPNKPKRSDRPATAADRIQTPPFKPSRGITIKQIDKVIREVMAKRGVQVDG